MAGALALTFGLFIGVPSTRATTYVWTKPAGGIWSDPTSWSPSGVPGPSDTGSFNDVGTYGFSGNASYTVTLTNNALLNVLALNCHSSSNETVTLNLNGYSLSLMKPGSSSPVALFIADNSPSQNTLYLSSSTTAGAGLFITNSASLRATIGNHGTGIMIVTNGFVQMGAAGVSGNKLVLGNNSGAQGTLVLDGPTVCWSNNGAVAIGNTSSAGASSVVISDSASMACVGASLTVGGAGSSGNSLLLDLGGQLFCTGVGANVGTASGSDNSATVQNGAIWDLGNTPLQIGGTGTGNSLTVGPNGTVSNATAVVISSGNSVILSVGELQAAVAITNNGGSIAGSGTLIGEVVFTGGGTLSPGSGSNLGTIIASNDLTLASDTTTIKLDKSQVGSNDLISAGGALTEAGTLVVNNVGPSLTGGEVFQIFSAGSFTGNFSATNLPSLTGGLFWDTSQLGSAGIIAVPLVLSVVGPTNQSFNVGDTVTISATVTGVPMPSLQWQYNGSNLSDGPTGNGSTISGSQASTLTISDAQAADWGHYCLIASNTGATQTNCMYLSQVGGPTPPTITGPANQSVLQGNTATFSASVLGNPTPTVQWQQNGVNIAGATTTSLVLTNVQVSQNGYVYSIIASNSVAQATNSATLTVTASGWTSPDLPVIPANVFLITNYGGYGDGASNNAAAIQNAINAAEAAGGGTVEVPSGGTLSTYLSGPILLTNSVNLQVDSGAMLQALPKASWPSATTAFITATNVHDVEISGSGTIDGQGSGWWSGGGTRPPLVQMAYTTRILIQNVTAQNPPFYHFRLIGGNTNITVQGVTVSTVTNSPNTDGVDFSGWNVLVQNCWIQDGDDDICVKNDTGLPSGHMVVSNCTFNGGHGVSVGSDTAGGVNGFIVSNCTWNSTINGIRLKSDNAASGSGAGGLVQNLTFRDLSMSNVQFPILIYSYYNETGTPDDITPQTAAGESAGSTNHCVIWRNIAISNLTVTATTGKNISGIIWGRLEEVVSNVTLDHVNITAPTKTFSIFNARDIRIIDSNMGDPNTTTNTFTLFNAEVTVTNRAANANLVTVCGAVVPGMNNTMGFFNAKATIGNTNVLGPNQILSVGGSTLTVSNAVNLGGSTLNFALGTNVADIAATGNLTLGGTLNVADGGGFTAGTYTLFTYGGTLTYNGLSIGPASNPNFTYTVSTDTHGQVNLIVSNNVTAPVAGFTANPLSGAAPLAVSFTDIPSNSPTAWYWTFGDGGTSTAESPTYTYLNPGSYTATLIASNAGGASTPVTQTIGVYAPFAWWQLQYFGSTNYNANTAPNADYTGTGMSNTNKFLAGFNPINSAAYLHIISIAEQLIGGNTNAVVTYIGANGDNTYAPGIASRTNVLDYTVGDASGNYTSGGWQDTGQTNVLSGGNGSGIVTNMTDTAIPAGTGARYYRVRVLLP